VVNRTVTKVFRHTNKWLLGRKIRSILHYIMHKCGKLSKSLLLFRKK